MYNNPNEKLHHYSPYNYYTASMCVKLVLIVYYINNNTYRLSSARSVVKLNV